MRKEVSYAVALAISQFKCRKKLCQRSNYLHLLFFFLRERQIRTEPLQQAHIEIAIKFMTL